MVVSVSVGLPLTDLCPLMPGSPPKLEYPCRLPTFTMSSDSKKPLEKDR
jgi:hypothetical protein